MHLEFSGDRVDEVLDFADIPANLVNHLSLPVNLLLGELEHTKVLLAHLLSRILFVSGFLSLHGDALQFKLKVFNLTSLLLHLAFFALCDSLKLTYFVIQVLDAPEQGGLSRVGIFHFVEL